MSSPLPDQAIKHLEFVQAVVGRLAGNAFLMKGWALTVAGAFFAFSARDVNWRIAAIGLVPVLAFWALDAYFLHRERLFRRLYDAVRRGDPTVEPFSMNYLAFIEPAGQKKCSYWGTLCSRTLVPLYLSLLIVGIVVILAAANHWGS